MTYRGTVKNGVVVLEGGQSPPDGTAVSVRVLKAPPRRAGGRRGKGRPARNGRGAETLYEGLKPFIGMANGLPADFSVNHDHYLYGTPKQE